MARQKTHYSVNPEALAKAKERADDLGISVPRVLGLLVREMLASKTVLDPNSLTLFGPRAHQTSITYDESDWQDTGGHFYPGYVEPRNRALVYAMLVNLYAAGQAHVRFDVVLPAYDGEGLT